MTVSVVLTVIGDDRPGIVETLSAVVSAQQGNWVESKLLSLAGKFAGVLLVTVTQEKADGLVEDLKALKAQGLQIIVERSDGAVYQVPSRDFSIELVGQDRPGIIRDITQVLTKYAINLIELDTNCQSASMSGEELFVASARVRIPDDLELSQLQADLERLANELMVDINLEE